MRRRDIFYGIGSTVASWPLAARAQQPMPLVGYLSARTPERSADILAAFREGLRNEGFVEGHNVVMEVRFAADNFDLLPALAGELVGHGVSVFVATGGTITILKSRPVLPPTLPVVFAMGGDPVKLGVVASLNRPGSNITGVSFLVNGLAEKQIQLLHEVVPAVVTVGFLMNPKDPNAETDVAAARKAADTYKQRLVVAGASNDSEIDAAFATFQRENIGALFIDAEPFLFDRRRKIADLARQYSLPAISQLRDFAIDGGLMAYGTSLTNANRELGVYVGKVLKGTKPADLPILQATKFELVFNVATAKAIGLEIPAIVLARADEVIE